MTIYIPNPSIGTSSPVALGSNVPTGQIRKFLKCLAHNNTGSAVPITIILVFPGAGLATNTAVVDYDLQPRETYTCPEIVGAYLSAGGSLQVQGQGVSFLFVASDTTNT